MKPIERHPFAAELRSLPPEEAAELEDHLMEALAAGLRAGLGEEEARQAALRSLGPPDKIGWACLRERSGEGGVHGGPSWAGWGVVVGWLALGAWSATRVCQATDPSHASLAVVTGLACACVTAALWVRRATGRAPWPLVAWSWTLAVAAAAGLLGKPWQPWVRDGLGLSPTSLAAMMFLGAASGAWLATRRWMASRRFARSSSSAGSPAP